MTKCHPTKPFRCPGVKNVCISLAYLCDGQVNFLFNFFDKQNERILNDDEK